MSAPAEIADAVRERAGDRRSYGALGLGYWNAGPLLQGLGARLVERGHDYDTLVERLTDEDFDESDFLAGSGGLLVEAAADALAVALGLAPRATLELVR